MKKNEKRALIFGSAIVLGAAAGAAVWYYKKKKKSLLDDNSSTLLLSEDESGDFDAVFNYSDAPIVSYKQAHNIASNVAKEKFGENPFVVSASDRKAIYEHIKGEKRAYYSFGADGSDFMGGIPRGFFYVDAETGEVFEPASGEINEN